MRLLTGAAFCGNCGARLEAKGRGHARYAYQCTALMRGIRASAGCKPAPSMAIPAVHALVSEWFLARYPTGEGMRKIYDPGTGHMTQIAELEGNARGCARTGRPGSTMTPMTPMTRNGSARNTGGSGRKSRR